MTYITEKRRSPQATPFPENISNTVLWVPPFVEAHPAFSVVHAADGLHGCGGGHSSPGRLEADRASAGVDN